MVVDSKIVVTGISILGACLASHSASAQSTTLVPFDQFYRQVAAATPSLAAAVPGSPAVDPAMLKPMRDHIVNLYAGVRVRHSFLLDAHPFDCVPTAQQPSVRQLGLTSIATPPDAPAAPGTARTADAFAQLAPSEASDPLGNATVCEAGTIPMRRVTMEDIGRFGSLRDFFQKGPGGAGRAPLGGAAPAVATSHKYAHSYQYVPNLGGSSFNNLWSPAVNTSLNEVFSLSQFWYSNDNGPVQTVEMGLQNYPQKYSTRDSVLFIYWTSDGYQNAGCYNLDCSGFVQTNSNVYLGRHFRHYSTNGGPQYTPQLTAYLTGGNWWLYLNGTASSNAIGYYPGSLFNDTPMATAANEIDYGGEVVGSTVWPPMGSGQFASSGFGHAAFDRNILYYPTGGGATSATLHASQTSPSCFTDVTTNASSNGGSGTHFYFGGPGGRGC